MAAYGDLVLQLIRDHLVGGRLFLDFFDRLGLLLLLLLHLLDFFLKGLNLLLEVRKLIGEDEGGAHEQKCTGA